MKSINKNYLIEIIYKEIDETIEIHRESKKNLFYYEPFPGTTGEEVLDFIISIPYFDVRLKDFLIGNLVEHSVLIDRKWENAFVHKTKEWAEGFEWLHGKDNFLNEPAMQYGRNAGDFLSLPY